MGRRALPPSANSGSIEGSERMSKEDTNRMEELRKAIDGITKKPEGPLFPVPAPPGPGQAIEIAHGVYWLSTFLPSRLRAVNLWLLRDHDGWTMVDCGFPLPAVRRQIEAAWDAVLGGMPIHRLVVTHHHPDHVGNCRWICQRWGIVPTMTSRERDQSEFLLGGRWRDSSRERVEFWLRHGLAEGEASEADRDLCRHLELCVTPPEEWNQVRDGDVLGIGDAEWQVVVASGHTPEQALLYSRQRNLLISGDQVLPQITPNVSVGFDEPEADPLTHFLESNRRIAQICEDAMVLPSHKLPFWGLQARIKAIERHHEEHLEVIERELRSGPRTAASLIPALFGDPKGLAGPDIAFALGESLSHLHHLVSQGRATTVVQKGEVVFVAR